MQRVLGHRLEGGGLRFGLRWLVIRSALLNLGILATALPVLAFAAGAEGLDAVALVLGGVSLLVWAATFAAYSFISLASLFSRPKGAKPGNDPAPAGGAMADPWLDGTR